MDYDVFISCKSDDYKYAETIYDYLRSNGINVFLASTELRQMGESEYRRAISQAMKSTYHIIIFASKAEFIDSPWVYYEWDMFLNAKLKGRKQGQILTILKDVEVEDINMDFWKYESFEFGNFRDCILTYVETPDSKQRKEQAKRKAQEEAEKIKKQKQEEQRINQIKKEIEDKETEYLRYLDKINRLVSDIVEKRKEIGENKKECPICCEKTFIDSKYCRKCGWTFIPTFSIKSFVSEEQLFIARSNWNCISKEYNDKSIDIQKKYQQAMMEITHLKEEIVRLLELNKFLENACKANITDFIIPENIVKIPDIAKRVAKTLFVNPSGASSNKTKGEGRRLAFAKLNRRNLVDTILQSCSSPRGSIFGMDRLIKVGFDEKKFRAIMEFTYGITFRTHELSTCNTVDNLKIYVARKANIKLD